MTLALGIGVNTTAFTALNQLLLQTVPYREPGRLVVISGAEPRNAHSGISPGDYFDLRDGNSVFEGVTAYVPYASNSLVEPGQPAVTVSANHVTANFFSTFGISPELGRTFSEEEERRMENLTLISNYYWREHFGADPKVLGRTVRLDGKVYTIIGVLPVGMDSPTLFNRRIAFWPLDPTRINFDLRTLTWYRAAARLKPGVSLQQASANLKAIGNRLAHEFPNTNTKRTFRVEAYPVDANQGTNADLTWLIMTLSLLVLAIACVNLANLQLVRTTRRAQEFAVRLALGSSRGRIVGMLLEESLILSCAGGLLALVVAKWGNAYTAQYLDINMPLDPRVFGFTFAASLLTGVAFGAVPAWIAVRQDVSLAVKAGARGATAGWARRAFREVLVVVELVLALAVISAAAYFVNGIFKLSHQDLGWDGSHAIFGQMTLDHDHFGESGDPRFVAFMDQLLEKLDAVPGVRTAAAGSALPGFGASPQPYRLEGRETPEPGHLMMVETGNVGPGFFPIYGIPIIKGRNFEATDRLGSRHVIIVNESMAKKCWPGEDPIGKRIGTFDPSVDPTATDWGEVVGVVKDYHHLFDFLGGGDGTKMFKPWAQNSGRFIFFHVMSVGEPATLTESIRRTVAQLAPDFAVNDLLPVKAMVEDAFTYFTFLRRVLVELSILGLTLAAVGIYGVIATLVSERTREIGIRMALGAQAASLVWLFLRGGLVLSSTGAVLGGGVAFAVVRTLAKMLPILPGYSLWAIILVALFLVFVALVSCFIPAFRSTRVDPSDALRTE